VMETAAFFGHALPAAAARPRVRTPRVGLLALALLAGSMAAVTVPRTAAGADMLRVVVRGLPGGAAAAARAVQSAGGQLAGVLGTVDEVVGNVPAAALDTLRGAPGVVEVTEDAPLHLLASSYDPVGDAGSAYNTTRITGAQAYWQAGYTGQGVDVALIDSGVVPVDGLTAAGKVALGPDLSWESQNPATAYLDTFGHGTHVAGLVAGRDDAAAAPYAGAPSNFTGMAPDARIVSVKVADAHGLTDVSQVIAAIDWVVQHRNDGVLHIRVLNLSFGTDSTQSWRYDPLAYAAEQAWRAGIVVVVSGGNGGTDTRTLDDPAYDPNLLAVGAADTQATVSTRDDTVASFSSTGAVRHPDLVAPGVHMVSLRDPGSYVDQTFSSTGAVGDRFFRGSGTSQSAAVVSGAAALVLSQHPEATPAQVKQVLVDSASRLSHEPENRQGAGELDLTRALSTRVLRDAVDNGDLARGTGTLEAARGSFHIIQNGVALSGEQDIFGHAWDSAAMAQAEVTGTSWSGGTWNGNTWSGNTWSGNTWSGNTWSGNTWSGNTWSGNTWSGNTWSGNTWSGNTWSGNTWSGNTWSGNTWSGSTWSGNTWSGNTWSGNTWSGNTWSGNTWSGNTWSGNTWSADAWLTSTWG
jgi:subtilisin family serine protease